ncbi:hypothetical protein ACS0TY_009853 [Phlomoides rotata]
MSKPPALESRRTAAASHLHATPRSLCAAPSSPYPCPIDAASIVMSSTRRFRSPQAVVVIFAASPRSLREDNKSQREIFGNTFVGEPTVYMKILRNIKRWSLASISALHDLLFTVDH